MIKQCKNWISERLLAKRPGVSEQENAAAEHTTLLQRGGQWLKKHGKKLCIGTAGLIGAVAIGAGAVVGYDDYMQSNTNEVFHVYIEDQYAGAVSSPQLVQNLIRDKRRDLHEDYPELQMVLNQVEVTYESEKGFKLESNDLAVLEHVDQTLNSQAIGVEVWVEDQLMGVVKDQDTADLVLAQIEQKYVPQSKSAAPVSILSYEEEQADGGQPAMATGQGNIESVEFIEEVRMQDTTVSPETIMDGEDLLNKLQLGDTKPLTYIVEAGDCVSCIAQKMDVDTALIYELNPWIQDDKLQIGDVIDLTVWQPALSVKTVEKKQEVVVLSFDTIYEEDDTVKLGIDQLITEGQNGSQLVTSHIIKVNGNFSAEEQVSVETIAEPVTQVILKGTKVVKGEGSGNFIWPVKGAKLSSGYGPRWGAQHKGTDFTSKNKTIYASDHGVVEKAEFHSGYGNYVIIDHKNGYKTLYAHMSKISTSKGSVVEQGEEIGVMGNTGNSTGVHLHLEVHKDGTPQNPMNYLD